MTRWLVVSGLWLVVLGFAAHAQQRSGPAPSEVDGPRFVSNTKLVRPANYREWIFLGSGLGMTYEAEAGRAPASPNFGNVFVNPSAYRAFMETGKWPNGSIFVLEGRRSATNARPNTSGRYQTELTGIEAEVKDTRFADGWAFYNFRNSADPADPIPAGNAAGCVECHTKETAVERTFVQFYPTLLDVARQKGTVKPGF